MRAIFVSMKFKKPLVIEIEKAKERFEVTGYTEDCTDIRAKGHCCHRTELDNQPIFKNWLGPMWDGGMLRYESREVYDMLSV